MNDRIKKLLVSKSWRLKNLYKIVDKHGKKVNFTPNSVQKLINLETANRKIILKARQFGVSTNELIKMLDFVCFKRNMTACIIAHENDAIAKLFRIVRHAYENMPDDIKPEPSKGGGSIYELYFPKINSRIYCDLESRGNTNQWLHVSEAAFMKDSSKLKSTLQSVPLGEGIVTIETTPNGLGNYFYDLWNDKDSTYKNLFYPWYVFPSYRLSTKENIIITEEEIILKEKAKRLFNIDIDNEQIAFRRFKKSELKPSSHDKTRVTFEQEYPEDEETCFLASGQRVVDPMTILDQRQMAKKPILEKDGFVIYDKPDKNKIYVCGADVSEGISKDFSSGVLMELRTREVVATIRGKYKPEHFADKLAYLCMQYVAPGKPPPELAVERNNHGHTVLFRLYDHCKYRNIYLDKDDERPGWKTTAISRPIMIDEFIDAFENKIIKVNDEIILNEVQTLVDNNGKIEAASGKNDDTIIACSIALQLCKKSSIIDLYDDIESKIII